MPPWLRHRRPASASFWHRESAFSNRRRPLKAPESASRARTDCPRGISSPVESIRAARWFRLAQLGGRIEPATASVVPCGTKYSIRGRVVPADVRCTALWREVVNHEQRILCLKSQGLEGISGGRPRARQMQSIHSRPKVLLFERCQFALERAGLSSDV